MRFSGFADEWNEDYLNKLFDNRNERNFESLEVLSVTINNGVLKRSDLGSDRKNKDKKSMKHVLKGDLVYNPMFMWKGASGISSYEGITSADYIVLKSKNNVNPIFFSHLFQTEKSLNKFKNYSQGSLLERLRLMYPQFSDIKMAFPSYEEQEKIANLLTFVDNKLELIEKKYQTYLDFKKYLMQQIFTQKLRFDFDGEWKNIPFKKLLKEINEKTTVNNQHEILSSTKEGIFTQKEYFANRNVASKDNTGYKILRKNQIVLSPQNLWMGNINVNTEFDIGIVSPSYKIYETTDLVDINYFKHIIKLPRLIYEYTCASEQGASIVRRNLNKELFNEITIKVPSSNEQEKIGKMFDAYDEKIKNIDKNIQDIKEFKKGLIQQMFVVRINWRCNFKLVKSPSFNKHLLILKNKIIFIIIK